MYCQFQYSHATKTKDSISTSIDTGASTAGMAFQQCQAWYPTTIIGV